MKLKRTVLLAAFVVTMFLPAAASAALVDNGDGLIYDDVLDITWAQPSDDANDWNSAKAWAEGLRLGGVSGWRLPYTSVAAGERFSTNPVKCSIASELDCRDNEPGYMFYHNLSGTLDQPIIDSGDPDLALFPTLQSSDYWSGTSNDIADATGWFFDFFQGTQVTGRSQPFLSWAVHTGNVVPSEATTVTIAAEGETLPDGTVLKEIDLDGGVAINISGKVAFGGRDDDNTGAVFTQDGLVAKEDDTLPDGNEVDDISPYGEVAINDLDQVAFHGKIEIEVEDGLFDTEEFDAVFTSDGLETLVAAREGSELPDLTTVQAIDENGGVAINLFGDVAFHGDVVVPDDAGGDTVKAVLTSDGLVAKKESPLPGGTIVSDIDENGGVAINLWGDVAFHGDVVDPDDGKDTVRAVLAVLVFTQDERVAKEGEILADGTILDEISESGGVAINVFGDVAFHGRTGGINAVFTQNGLVAKEGDTLSDGTILGEIHQNGGVAINTLGQVAFHGKVGTTDVVLVGEAPLPPVEDPPDEGDESSSE
jgi:hypothetical protein